MKLDDILSFWFNDIDESKWWLKDEAFDKFIKDRFLAVHEQANTVSFLNGDSLLKAV